MVFQKAQLDFLKICFWMLFKSRNFIGFILFENQLFKVSIVNFSSTENGSVRKVDFSRANTAEAIPLS